MSKDFKPLGVMLQQLCSHVGALEGLVQRGDQLLDTNLFISDDKAETIVKKIDFIATQYRKSSRLFTEIFMGGPKGHMLIVCSDLGAVSLIFKRVPERMESVIAECRSFLGQALGEEPPTSEVLPGEKKAETTRIKVEGLKRPLQSAPAV